MSVEFKTVRRRAAEILTAKGYEPVFQDIFGAQPGGLRDMHCEKLDSCDGLIQIAGLAYGWEPVDPVTGDVVNDKDYGRCSYTQFEFLYAREKGKKTWLFVAGSGVTRDTPSDQLDRPFGPRPLHSDPWQSERRALQQAYQQRPEFNRHLRHAVEYDTDLELALERLDDELVKLRAEHEKWKAGILQEVSKGRKDQRKGLWIGVGIALLTTAILITLWLIWPKPVIDDATAIRHRLMESSERQLESDLAAAKKEKSSAKREERSNAARNAHEERTHRIDDIAQRFAELHGSDRASEVMTELSRILREESIENALAYIESKKATLLAEAKKRFEEAQARNKADLHRELSPLLTAADLKVNRRKYDEAREEYEALLALDSDWRDAQQGYVQLLTNFNASQQRPPPSRLEDAKKAHDIALLLHKRNPADPRNQYLLSATHSTLGYELNARRRNENVEAAAKHYADGVALGQSLYDRDPLSEDYAENLAKLYYRWALLLARNGATAASETAAQYLEKALAIQERRLAAHPTSRLAKLRVPQYSDSLTREYFRTGKAGKAFSFYEKTLRSRQAVVQSSGKALGLSDVVISRCLDTAEKAVSGEFPGGLPEAQRWWTLAYEMIKTSPPDARDYPNALCDYAENLGNLADSYVRGGKGDLGLGVYREAISLLENSWETRRQLTDDLSGAPNAVTVSDILGALSGILQKQAEFHAGHQKPPDIGEAIRLARRNEELLSAFLKQQPEWDGDLELLFPARLKLAEYLLRRREGTDETEAVQCYRRNFDAVASRSTKVSQSNEIGDHLWRAALKLAAYVDQEESNSLQKRARSILEPLKRDQDNWTDSDEEELTQLRSEMIARGKTVIP